MSSYKGVVSHIDHKSGRYGFIDLSTVTMEDGSPHGLETKEDIFIHLDDSYDLTKLWTGMIVMFDIGEDPKRENAFRAQWPKAAPFDPIRDGIELYFDERVIDHPTVSIRWCIRPEVLKLIRRCFPEHTLYLAFAATKKGDVSSTVYETVVGANGVGDGRGFVTFNSPGEYTLVAYLMVSLHNERDVKKRLKNVKPRQIHIWKGLEKNHDLETRPGGLEFPCVKDEENDTLITLTSVKVRVPDGIFAKPLPSWVKKWLSYFGSGLANPEDECSMRTNLILTFTLGLVWYILYETTKRVCMLILGALHLLIGGNPFKVWKVAFSGELSAILWDFWGKREYESIADWSDRGKFLLHPLFLVFVGSVVGSWIYFPQHHEDMIAITSIILGIITLVILAFILIDKLIPKLKVKSKKRFDAYTKQHNLTGYKRIEEFAVCGTVPEREPKSVKLFFSGVKQKVCRTYSR